MFSHIISIIYGVNNDNSFNDDDFYHFDTNNDGIIDAGELVVPVSGKKSKVGIIPKPSVITSADGKVEYKSRDWFINTCYTVIKSLS